MFQKLPANGFKWKKKSKFHEKFIKNYDEDSNNRYCLEVDVEYPKDLHNLHSNLRAHIRALKQTLNHGLILKKEHTVIQFNQEAWLKPYIEKNTKLKVHSQVWGNFWQLKAL